MRRIGLVLSVMSVVVALGACSTSTEPAAIETPTATPGQAGDDVDYLTCRPNCSNENFYRLDLSNADRSGIDFDGSRLQSSWSEVAPDVSVSRCA